jgi:antitoxin component YwqK of YwqJK toxin-antitoxin module
MIPKILFKKYFFKIVLIIFVSSCNSLIQKEGEGTKIIYFPNSEKICQQIDYKNGKKNGLFLEYYNNGKIKFRKKYINDKLNDTACFYFKNGIISQLQILKDGNKVGCWKKFNEEGKPYAELNFKNDMLHGECNTYTYRTLRPLSLLNYINGNLHGKQQKFYSNGKPKCISFFDHGVACIGTQEWLDNGNEIKYNISFNIQEKNTLVLNNELKYLITCTDAKEDDKIVLCGNKDMGINVNPAYTLQKVGKAFQYKINLAQHSYVMEKVKFALFRKTPMNNTIVKVFYINVAANNY